MSDQIVHELATEVSARITAEMPALSPALDALVERMWQQACVRMARGTAGALFNGKVFSADRITPTLITGHLTEFRRIVAQFERPALFAELGLRPLAVCGVLCCAEGVVVGRRHVDAIYQAGLWQLPPAGSVDASAVAPDGTVDLPHQILLELREELGLPPETVGRPRPLCVVEHADTHVCDLGMALHTALAGEAVLASHATAGNQEYEPLAVIPFAHLQRFVAERGEALVPSALAFLTRARLPGIARLPSI